MVTTPERMLKRIGITGLAAAILMIIFGVLVIKFQELVAWLVGIYLIVVGVVKLVGYISGGKSS